MRCDVFFFKTRYFFYFQGIIKDEDDEDGEGGKSSEPKETKTKEQLAEEERERMLWVNPIKQFLISYLNTWSIESIFPTSWN